MGVFEGRAQLGKSMKELMLHWSETKMSWDDSQSKQFEEKFLAPMEADLRNAVGAMDHMAVILQQIRRDCE